MQPPRGGGLFIGRVRQYAFTYARALPRGVYAFRATPHGPAEPRHRHMAWLIGAEAAPPRQLPRFYPPAPSAAHQSACLSSLPDSPSLFFAPLFLARFLRPGCDRWRGGDRAYRGESSFCRDSSLLFDSLFPCFFSFFFFFSAGLFLEARKKGVCCSSLFDLRRITDSYFILYFFEEDAFDEIFADS